VTKELFPTPLPFTAHGHFVLVSTKNHCKCKRSEEIIIIKEIKLDPCLRYAITNMLYKVGYIGFSCEVTVSCRHIGAIVCAVLVVL